MTARRAIATGAVLRRKLRTAARLAAEAARRRVAWIAPWAGTAAPRVLIVAGSEGAPLRYRVLNQAEQLELEGVARACCSDSYLGLAAQAASCDILYLCRAHNTPRVRRAIEAARASGAAVVYDTDDLIWDQRLVEYCALDRYYSPEDVARLRAQFRAAEAIMREVDAFVASTEYLAGLLREHFGRPALVSENAIGSATVEQSRAHYKRRQAAPLAGAERVTLAYFSGWPRAHEIDLAVALPGVLAALAELPGARLRIVGHFDTSALPDALRGRVETAPFVPYERLFESIAEVDINLAPIVDNPHRRSKSAVKYLEAALVGVPTIASDLEPYRAIDHGRTGLRASDDAGWRASILALARDPQLRREMGRAAREQVLASDTAAARAPHFAALLRDIAARHQARNR